MSTPDRGYFGNDRVWNTDDLITEDAAALERFLAQNNPVNDADAHSATVSDARSVTEPEAENLPSTDGISAEPTAPISANLLDAPNSPRAEDEPDVELEDAEMGGTEAEAKVEEELVEKDITEDTGYTRNARHACTTRRIRSAACSIESCIGSSGQVSPRCTDTSDHPAEL